jgi:hypothetical protein
MDWVQVGCWVGFGLFAAVQLAHTLRNTNRWPFAAQNMFSHDAPVMTRLMVVLYDSLGGERVVFPYSVLPVEFFRAQRVLSQVYLESGDFERQERFACALLDRLNDAPWSAFDEVDASARPPAGARFEGFELVLYEYTLDAYVPGAELTSIRRPLELVCSCRNEPSAPEPAREVSTAASEGLDVSDAISAKVAS